MLPFMVMYEYLAVLMALVLIRMEGLRCAGYACEVIGDITSSLSRCAKRRAWSQRLVTAANTVHNLLTVEMGVPLASTNHIPGRRQHPM